MFSKLVFAFRIGSKVYGKLRGRKKPGIDDVPDLIFELFSFYKEGRNMKSKFGSKKFTAAFSTLILTVVGSFVSPEAMVQLTPIILGIFGLVGLYITGQSVIDSKNPEKH